MILFVDNCPPPDHKPQFKQCLRLVVHTKVFGIRCEHTTNNNAYANNRATISHLTTSGRPLKHATHHTIHYKTMWADACHRVLIHGHLIMQGIIRSPLNLQWIIQLYIVIHQTCTLISHYSIFIGLKFV